MKKYQYAINLTGQDAPAKILSLVGTGKRVLEVGCASGVQTRIMKEHLNCRVTGIEIDADAAEEARKYCESVIIGDLETMDFDQVLEERRFDVITIADVLEHLRNPTTVLSRLKEFLDGDGVILASIPNVVHAGLILEMASGRFDYRPYGLLDDTHIRFFTLKGVYRLFEDCSLEIRGLDRVIRCVEESEFFKHPVSDTEADVLRFIQASNPEWQTYQFIVTAAPRIHEAKSSSHAEIEHQENVKDLELIIQSLRKRVGALECQLRTLESQICWIESRPAYKLYSRVKGMLRPKPEQ